MKTYDYIIVFKTRDYRIIDRISQFMLLLAIAVIIFAAFVPFSKVSVLPLLIAAFIMGWWIYISRKQKKDGTAYYRLALLFAAWGWYLQPKGLLPAIIYLAAALLEKQAKFPEEVAFDDEGIVINSFPKKHYKWADLSNVLLKDNLLTIDFKNNRLIQKETDNPVVSAREERDFNEFCRKRLFAERPGN